MTAPTTPPGRCRITRARTVALAGATATIALTLAACGGSSRPTPPQVPAMANPPIAAPRTAAPTRPPPPVSRQVPTAAPAGRDVEQAASRYLAARENAISYQHRNTTDWLADVRPTMTRTAWTRLASSVGDGGGYPRATAAACRWSVQTTTSCRHDPDAGPPTPTAITLICAVTDHTVDAAGRPVPAAALPALWPYTGPQPPAILAMHNLAGRWLVDADLTGQAG